MGEMSALEHNKGVGATAQTLNLPILYLASVVILQQCCDATHTLFTQNLLYFFSHLQL